MKINFVLIATGHVTMPRINHAILTNTNNGTEAINEVKPVIAALSKAGYFNFILYTVSEDDNHKPIAEFRVDTPEPVVVTTTKY